MGNPEEQTAPQASGLRGNCRQDVALLFLGQFPDTSIFPLSSWASYFSLIPPKGGDQAKIGGKREADINR